MVLQKNKTLNVSPAFWIEKEKRHDSFCKALKALNQRRKALHFELDNILDKKRKAREELRSAVKDAKKLIIEIQERTNTLNYIKKKWLCSGTGTEDNFYLNMTANAITRELGEYLKHKEEFITVIPQKKKEIVEFLNIEYEELKSQLKVNKKTFRELQFRLDENSKEEIVDTYQEDVPHYCEAQLETIQYQLQIRKKTYKKINDLSYIKNKGKWFLIDKDLHEIEVEEVRRNNLERIVNKKHR